MRLVIISSLGAAHCHVVAETVRRHHVAAVLRPVSARSVPASATARWARFRDAPLAVLRQGLEQRARHRRMERLETALFARLFQGQPPALEAEPVAVPELSGPGVVERLRRLSPDLLLVCGAPVLAPAIFTVPRLGAVNLHHGVAPRYRGEDTLFWPLVRQDWDHLGVTLHYIDAGVDTGRVIAHGFPARRGGEDEADLWASAARLGAELIHRFLRACDSGAPPGRAQEPGGKQYFRRERTIAWDARHRALRLLGKVPPPSEERTVFY